MNAPERDRLSAAGEAACEGARRAQRARSASLETRLMGPAPTGAPGDVNGIITMI